MATVLTVSFPMKYFQQIINFGAFKLRKGDDVTIKIMHVKGSTVKMLDPKGID